MGGLTALCVADDPQVEAVVALAPWLNSETPVEPRHRPPGPDRARHRGPLDQSRRTRSPTPGAPRASPNPWTTSPSRVPGTSCSAGWACGTARQRLRPRRLRRRSRGPTSRPGSSERPPRSLLPAAGAAAAGGVVMPAFPLEPSSPASRGWPPGSWCCWPLTFAVAVRQSRHSVIDTVWGLGFVVVAGISWLLSAGHGDGGRRLLLLALVAVWGIRLAVHIGLRARGGHEDPRYVDMLSSAPGSRNVYALRRVYLPQGVVMFFVSLTVQVGMFAPAAWAGSPSLGVLLWIVGFVFETVGDWQLDAVQGRPRQARHRAQHGPLALHPPPELLRRRRRLGRPLPRRRRFLARRADQSSPPP